MSPIVTTLLLCLPAAAADSWVLTDAGDSRPGPETALIVVTPGVPEEAYLPWVQALEAEEIDAWTLRFPPRGQDVDEVVAGLQAAWSELSEARPKLALMAHGYGGVFALLAAPDPDPAALALIGTPLGAQPVPPTLGPAPEVVADALPFSAELTGGLPTEPYSAELAAAYGGWATAFPPYEVPPGPTLLLASGLDPVGPPEVVRLPSQGWPGRRWVRAGMLNLEPEDHSHAELLTDPALARRVARMVAEELAR